MKQEELHAILKNATEVGASDIHLCVNEVPVYRIDGEIIKTPLAQLTEDDILDVINYTVPQQLKNNVLEGYDSDYPFELKDLSRYRVNVAKAFGYHTVTIRLIPYNIPTFEDLKLPASIERLSDYDNGIILVTGVAGSGKSTTIASVLEKINQTKQKHIVTIEDPIEYEYKNKKSIFTQRQVGIDTKDYHSALKYTLRQDPDIILIGEIRDAETIKSALYAAETGHLVFATLHTFNAVQTINRVLSFFEPTERDAIRRQFAEVFRASSSQKLLPQASGQGRIVAIELLFSNPTIKDFIIKDEFNEIYKLASNGKYRDITTFNSYLYKLYKNELITQEVALENSDIPGELMRMIKGVY